MKFCSTCDRSFASEEALAQHLRDSPVHAPSFDCDTCDRSFASEEALAQHLRDSPVHAPSFDCDTCDRSFASEEALAQHLRDSPVHAPSFDCDTCDRSFASEEALAQHLRDSPVYASLRDTPLDEFFNTFPLFVYDATLSPADSYASLRRCYGWRRGDPESDDAWDRYQNALKEELKLWLGAETDLIAWHSLCRAIKIEPLPPTCRDCEKVPDILTRICG
jgi:heat shock protein HspQ